MKDRLLLALAGLFAAVSFFVWPDLTAFMAGLPYDTKSVFLGLQTWQWISLGVLLAMALAVAFSVSNAVKRLFKLKTRFAPSRSSPQAQRGIRRSIGWLSSVFLCQVAAGPVGFPAKWSPNVDKVIQVLLVAGFIWLAYSIWDAVCDTLLARSEDMSKKAEKILIPIARKLVRFLIVVGGTLIGLAWMGANIVGALAGLGIGGLAVALAAKDSLENILGSLTLLFDMPFGIGDWIKIGGTEGSVEEINIRSTRIRTAEDSMVTLPNSNLISASVENFGARRFRRFRTQIVVSWETPSKSIEQFCANLKGDIGQMPNVRRDGLYVAPIEAKDLGLAVLVQGLIECDTFDEEIAAKARIMTAACRRIEEAGVKGVYEKP